MSDQKTKAVESKVLGPSSRFSYENDSIDHINILFRKAATRLGHNLSHFTRAKFTHPYFGQFLSMEGFWFWIRAGRQGEGLRYLSGFKAKEQGRLLPAKWTPHFEEDIMAGNYQKIIQNPPILDEFVASTLPFTHYYLMPAFNRNRGRDGQPLPRGVTRQPDADEQVSQIKIGARGEDWLCKGFEDLRTAIKEGRVPDCWLNAEKRYINEPNIKILQSSVTAASHDE